EVDRRDEQQIDHRDRTADEHGAALAPAPEHDAAGEREQPPGREREQAIVWRERRAVERGAAQRRDAEEALLVVLGEGLRGVVPGAQRAAEAGGVVREQRRDRDRGGGGGHRERAPELAPRLRPRQRDERVRRERRQRERG